MSAVPAGYKQTEVGVIPEDWAVRYLADVSRKITDGDHVTSLRTSHGYYLLSARNVLNGRIDVSDVDYVGAAEYRRMKQRCGPEAGDILISCSGTIGRVAVVLSGFECVLVRSAALAKIDHGLADSVFLQFWLQGNKAQGQIAGSVNQGAQPNLFLNHIERLACPHPPLPEQRAIAAALSDVDALLAKLDQLIAKKRDLKQATMQQLLTGQTRLPGFHGEWEVRRLGAVCRITIGKKDVNEGNPNGQFPFFTCSRTHTFSDSYSFDAEAILIAGNGEVGNLHYINGKFEAYQRTYVLCAFSAHVRYLWQQLNAYLADSLGLGKIGSSIPYIKKENLIDFEFKSPRDTAEQTAIAEVLTEMDGELAALEQRRAKTPTLKQGMMQELLTGRTRLVSAEHVYA